MNNIAVLSPHTIKMDNSAVLLSVHVGDRVSLFPRSGVYGGTKVSEGVLLGSHCRPFRGQTIAGHAEYNETPCTAFVNTEAAQDGFLGQEDGVSELLINRKPLTKSRVIEIIGEVLAGFVGGESGDSLPTPTDSSGMEEIQLDSLELVEFAEQLKIKFHVRVSIDALLDLVTVSDIADAFMAGEL